MIGLGWVECQIPSAELYKNIALKYYDKMFCHDKVPQTLSQLVSKASKARQVSQPASVSLQFVAWGSIFSFSGGMVRTGPLACLSPFAVDKSHLLRFQVSKLP